MYSSPCSIAAMCSTALPVSLVASLRSSSFRCGQLPHSCCTSTNNKGACQRRGHALMCWILRVVGGGEDCLQPRRQPQPKTAHGFYIAGVLGHKASSSRYRLKPGIGWGWVFLNTEFQQAAPANSLSRPKK